MANNDVFSMSDDEFDKINLEEKTNELAESELTSEKANSNISSSSAEEASNPEANNSTGADSSSGSNDELSNSDANKVDEPNADAGTYADSNGDENEPSETSDLGSQSTTPLEDEDKLSWYEKLSKPFKANGHDFKVRSPEESIKLMQLGLNYTKKMQALANDRKLAETFKSANITTPEQVGFLLDLTNGNKDAIKQLLKNHKIDPSDLMDYDLDDDDESSTKQAYTPTTPTPVTDHYLALKDHIEELSTLPKGTETVKMVLEMDNESKQVIYNNPALMDSLRVHLSDKRPSGLTTYQEVVNEMERLKSLGELPPDTPFVYGYKVAGDRLYGSPTANNGYLGTSKGQAMSQNNNNDRVRQASIPRSGSAGKGINKDIFAMSDEEFAKLSL